MIRSAHPLSITLCALTLALTACPEAPPALQVSEPTGCDPMDTALCSLPYPSNHFTEADDTTETGLRVAFADGVMPQNIDGVDFDNTLWNRRDGFSVGSSMITWFDDVSLDGTVPLDNIAAYLDDDARTVILNAETGERVPHFVELDMTAEREGERLLMIRPVERLEFGTRYVVGIRGLTTNAGGDVAVSDGFLAVRDAEPTADGDIELRRAHYESSIFPVLADDGFARADLQLAWDFTTASRTSTLGDMMWVRDDALAWTDAGITYEIDEIEDRDCSTPNNGRVIKGHLTNFPLYRTSSEPAAGLARDAQGSPMRNGTTDVDWTLRIPCSVVADPRPSPLVQYGHGFFGDQSESGTGWLREFTDEHGLVVIASDWTGMEERDALPFVGAIANNASNFSNLPEGTFQGFAEFMAVLRLARGPLASDPATQLDVDGTPTPVIDGDDFAYYGISQGGILGGAYVGMSPDIERAVFGVTGGPYAFLTHRAVNFDPFFAVFKVFYEDHREIGVIIQHLQMLWDPGDNVGWGYDMNRDVPAGYPAKRVLIQNAIGDSQVSTYGGQIQARMYGVNTVAPQARPVFGVEERTAPFTGSALVEWRYSDVPDVPLTNTPPNSDFDPHECPRRHPDAQAQVARFLSAGEVVQLCDGVCTDVQATCR